jgi:hypothetical protein
LSFYGKVWSIFIFLKSNLRLNIGIRYNNFKVSFMLISQGIFRYGIFLKKTSLISAKIDSPGRPPVPAARLMARPDGLAAWLMAQPLALATPAGRLSGKKFIGAFGTVGTFRSFGRNWPEIKRRKTPGPGRVALWDISLGCGILAWSKGTSHERA